MMALTAFTQFENYFAERLFYEERRSKIVRDYLSLKETNHGLIEAKFDRIAYQTKHLEAVIREYLQNLLARIHSILDNDMSEDLSGKLYLPDMLSILQQNCSYLCNNLKQSNFLHSTIMIKYYEKEFECIILQDPTIETFHREIYNFFVEKYNANSNRETLYKVVRYRNHIWRVNSERLALRDKYYNVFLGRIIPEVKDLFEQLKSRLSSQENLIKSLGQVTQYLIELQNNLRNIFPITQVDMNRILEFIFQHCFNEIEKFTISNQNGFTSLLLDLNLNIRDDNIYLYAELLKTFATLTSFISSQIFLPLFEKICDDYYEKNLYLFIENKILNLCDHKDYIELACHFINLLELDEIYTRFNVEKVFGKRTITNPTRKWIEKLINQYQGKIILSIATFVNIFSLSFFDRDKTIKNSIVEGYLERLQNREQFWAKVSKTPNCLGSKYFLISNEFEHFFDQRKDIILHRSPALPILIQTLAILKFLPKFNKLVDCYHHMFTRDHLLFNNFTESPKENYLALSSVFHDLFISEIRKIMNEMVNDIEPFLPWTLNSNEHQDIKRKFTGNGGEFRLKKMFLEDSDVLVHTLRLANFKTLHCDRVKFNIEFEKHLHQKCLSIDNFTTRDAVVNTLYSNAKIQQTLPGGRKVNLLVTLNQLAVLNKFLSVDSSLRLSELIDGFVYEENGILSVNSLLSARILRKNSSSTYMLDGDFGKNDPSLLLTSKAQKQFYDPSQPYYDLRLFAHNLMRHLMDDIRAILGNSKKYVENFQFLLKAQSGSVKSQKFNKDNGQTVAIGNLSILKSYHTMRLREMICRVLKRHKIMSGVNNIFTSVNAEVLKVNQERNKKSEPEVNQFLMSEVATELDQLVNIGMLENEMGERYNYII